MRNIVVSLALAVLFSLPALAQEGYKAEIFGGYQYTRVSPGDGFGATNLNGWNASVTGNFRSWLGVTADFSGGYQTIDGFNTHMTNYLFGPTISYKFDRIKPFAHVLFGESQATASLEDLGAGNVSAFAMAFGGGVDAGVTRHLAVRLFQADYFRTAFNSEGQNNIRLSTGLVFRF